VHHPENDWALIRLTANVVDTIVPMTIATVEPAQLPNALRLSMAGFPSDRRAAHGDQLDLKDLWGTDGRVVGIVWESTQGAVIESTLQAALGNSGSPVYGDFEGRRHLVIGMHQGLGRRAQPRDLLHPWYVGKHPRRPGVDALPITSRNSFFYGILIPSCIRCGMRQSNGYAGTNT
jgi:hypothetical protein